MDKQKENFERLVRSHKDTIYTVCYMFSKDEDEVADLFQETLINVWRGLPKYQGGDEALRGWIYRVALNTCISLDRSKRRRKTVPLTMDSNALELLKSGVLTSDDYAAFMEKYDSNPTMLKLLAHYAAEAAKATETTLCSLSCSLLGKALLQTSKAKLIIELTFFLIT